jgi:hypothetical protein
VPGACLEEEEGGCRDGVSCERWRPPRLPTYKEAQVGTQKVPGRLYTVHGHTCILHTRTRECIYGYRQVLSGRSCMHDCKWI